MNELRVVKKSKLPNVEDFVNEPGRSLRAQERAAVQAMAARARERKVKRAAALRLCYEVGGCLLLGISILAAAKSGAIAQPLARHLWEGCLVVAAWCGRPLWERITK